MLPQRCFGARGARNLATRPGPVKDGSRPPKSLLKGPACNGFVAELAGPGARQPLNADFTSWFMSTTMAQMPRGRPRKQQGEVQGSAAITAAAIESP